MLLLDIEELRKTNPKISIDEINEKIKEQIKLMKKEDIKLYRREYYIKNRLKILERQKQYYKNRKNANIS